VTSSQSRDLSKGELKIDKPEFDSLISEKCRTCDYAERDYRRTSYVREYISLPAASISMSTIESNRAESTRRISTQSTGVVRDEK
jgi:hypothetical protein